MPKVAEFYKECKLVGSGSMSFIIPARIVKELGLKEYDTLRVQIEKMENSYYARNIND